VALNTILHDDELDAAQTMVRQVYEAGADALIVQDMGLLELDLPPIQLHASTQTDNRTAEKVHFLEQVGFSQIVLARELSLAEIRNIADKSSATLEFFVHGALCVAFSGQCYISHAHTGRSANRGECSQACRLPYTLTDPKGRVVAHEKHLLSMKDNDQSDNLAALIDAGIRSFKIEGRLKDLGYVKNITAHYRQRLDRIMEHAPQYRRASSGQCSYTFSPQPEKTFNRGATDYFVTARKTDIGALGTDWIELHTAARLANGDGISTYDDHDELVGARINVVETVGRRQRLYPAEMPADIRIGKAVYRNRDQAFERALEKKSAERHIGVALHFTETTDGFALTLTDEDGVSASATLIHAKEPAKQAERATASTHEHLAKLGNTLFMATAIVLDTTQSWFIPAAALNSLRRDAVANLEAARHAAYQRPAPGTAVAPPPAFPETELTYLGNVFNSRARTFYEKHGVKLIADAYEADQEKGAVSLMITKHCLRFSYNLCPKQVKGYKGVIAVAPEPMTLINGKEKLTLRFDCKKCEMHVVGKPHKHRPIQLTVKAA
jgi:putative protease